MSMSDVVQQFGLVGTQGELVSLQGVTVSGEVLGAFAEITVVQRYRNDEPRAIEAIYTFPLPTDASVTGFTMTVAEKLLEGTVLEREEAFRKYDEALVAGDGAALLEQERPNVFTASVGNLLPGEETIIHVRYVQKLRTDEGAIRLAVPTLVAPRYIPGNSSSDLGRTADGTVAPTDRVPDADRISPRQADVDYRVTLDLLWLGEGAAISSPSHAIVSNKEARGTRLSFAAGAVALDRDVIILGEPKGDATSIEQVVAHRGAADDGEGFVALTLVPELAGKATNEGPKGAVVFVLDRSGSMSGDAMTEARRALSLCLRHLRPGERFAILAFDTRVERLNEQPDVFGQRSLGAADAFLASVDARGGTELLEPLLEAVKLAGPGGHVVLLTDGEVGNEDEIAAKVIPPAAAEGIAIHAFAIGLNVSDALLARLARSTGGALASIYPGERIDEKVVSVFSRATAARVHGLSIDFEGFEVEDLAPGNLPPYVDGEPFTLLGRYTRGGSGSVRISGKLHGATYTKRVAVTLPEQAEAKGLPALWAKARIVDLEDQALDGRRAEAMKKRIVELSKKYGVSSRYTSFVVIEKRSRERKVNEAAVARSVPVNAPALHASSSQASGMGGQNVNKTFTRSRGGYGGAATGAPPPPMMMPSPAMAMPAPPPPPPGAASVRATAAPPVQPAPYAPGPLAPPPPAPAAASPKGAPASGDVDDAAQKTSFMKRVAQKLGWNEKSEERGKRVSDGGGFVNPAPMADEADEEVHSLVRSEGAMDRPMAEPPEAAAPAGQVTAQGAERWLEAQRASGLFGADEGEPARVATVAALRACLAEGFTTSHAVYGAQIKRALHAAIVLLDASPAPSPDSIALAALLVLLAEGRVTSKEVRAAVLAAKGSGDVVKSIDDVATLRKLAAG